ncbi:hypothetical protein ACTXT7_017421, partial [Hymenolepis weldensis]
IHLLIKGAVVLISGENYVEAMGISQLHDYLTAHKVERDFLNSEQAPSFADPFIMSQH